MHLQYRIQDRIMRNPKSLKEGHGLPEYVAYANLRQGIRPFVRATRYSIAVVRPPGTEAAAYQSAARIYVGSRRFESIRVVDCQSTLMGSQSTLSGIQSTLMWRCR
jgi:hypothetical protein